MAKIMTSPETGIKYTKIGDDWFSSANERLLFLRDKNYSVGTEVDIKEINGRSVALCKATVRFRDNTYTGHALQSFHDPVWGKFAVQVSETKAVSRALGMAGIGIEYGFSSFDEVSYGDTDEIAQTKSETISNELNKMLNKTPKNNGTK